MTPVEAAYFVVGVGPAFVLSGHLDESGPDWSVSLSVGLTDDVAI